MMICVCQCMQAPKVAGPSRVKEGVAALVRVCIHMHACRLVTGLVWNGRPRNRKALCTDKLALAAKSFH